jgi:predicted transposase/invertase (TIGR01784 family)
LDNISTNEDERAKFRARRKFQMDMAHDRAYLLRIGEENLLKGRLEGKLEGRLEGKLEGRLEGKLETARNLIRRGRPIDEIIEDTGLARAEIEGLRKDI